MSLREKNPILSLPFTVHWTKKNNTHTLTLQCYTIQMSRKVVCQYLHAHVHIHLYITCVMTAVYGRVIAHFLCLWVGVTAVVDVSRQVAFSCGIKDLQRERERERERGYLLGNWWCLHRRWDCEINFWQFVHQQVLLSLFVSKLACKLSSKLVN